MPISIESEDQYRRLGSHHLFNQIDSITHEDYLYERFSRFKTSVRQSYDIFYIIPVTINFTEFSYNVDSVYIIDKPRTLLISPIKSRDLATRDQTGVSFATP